MPLLFLNGYARTEFTNCQNPKALKRARHFNSYLQNQEDKYTTSFHIPYICLVNKLKSEKTTVSYIFHPVFIPVYATLYYLF
jgi:hypothetical protein